MPRSQTRAELGSVFCYGCCWEVRSSREITSVVRAASEEKKTTPTTKKQERFTGTVGRLCKSEKIGSKLRRYCGFMPQAKRYIPSLEWGITETGAYGRTGRELWTSQRCHCMWWWVPCRQPRKRCTRSRKMCHYLPSSSSSSSSLPLVVPSPYLRPTGEQRGECVPRTRHSLTYAKDRKRRERKRASRGQGSNEGCGKEWMRKEQWKQQGNTIMRHGSDGESDEEQSRVATSGGEVRRRTVETWREDDSLGEESTG